MVLTAASGDALRNLGPQSMTMLASVGVTTLAQLRERGAVATWMQVKQVHRQASLNLLYALVGALEGCPLACDWRVIQRERKLSLLLAVEEHGHRHG